MTFRRPRLDANTIATLLFAAAGAYLLWWVWQWYADRPPWVDPIGKQIRETGLKETGKIAVIAVVGSAVVGVLLGTLMTIRFLPLRTAIRSYIEVWRGLPIIVTIFLIIFVEPKTLDIIPGSLLGWQIDSGERAAIGLALWGSAQVAEATRGAVQSIPREQHEAAAALGFGWVGRHSFVILPQAFRRLLPPGVSLLVNVTQNTTLAAIVGVSEVLETGNRSTERLLFTTGDSHALEIYLGILAVFFVISFPLTRLARFLERRLV